ncbi:MAG: gliding motility-associated C-terminal domain-containing protein [bacterium]|nr:gliding motility-associated C-terminal domain-containing protein [bacterium]
MATPSPILLGLMRAISPFTLPVARLAGASWLQLCLVPCLVLCLVPAPVEAQFVLHWGKPATTTAAIGGTVRASDWTVHHEAAGEASFLDMTAGELRPLQMDPDFNLAQRATALGGVFDNKERAFDGDPRTNWLHSGYKCIWIREGCRGIFATVGTNDIDLGGQFLVDRVVLRSGLRDPALTVRDFRIHLNPEVPKSLWCCSLMDPIVADIRDNRQQVRDIQISSEQRTRFFQLAIGETEVGWEIQDIEIYGRGFVERATYTSDVVAFDQPMAWGHLRWSAEAGAGTRVRLQTRTGSDDEPTSYWRFTGRVQDKEEVSRAQYENLAPGERAGTSYDHEHWSFWSEPYDLADSSGTQMLSPGPRQFFQFRVDFQPDTEGGVVRFVELEAWPPAAAALIGEIWPVQTTAGSMRTYTYALRPTISARHSGFDRLEISSPSFLGAVQQVRIADAAVPRDVELTELHRLVLRLPHIRAGDSGTLIEVDFEAQVLRYGTRFDGRVWNSAQTPRMAQRVDPGDASAEFDGNRVSVATDEESDRLLRVEMSLAVLTPNGDGINDELTIAYDVFEMTSDAAVSVGVYDLSGRLVRRLYEGQDGVGRYRSTWDGTDDDGRALPPGVYLLRLVLGTDGNSDTRTEIVHVVR